MVAMRWAVAVTVVVSACAAPEQPPTEPTAAERATWLAYGRAHPFDPTAWGELELNDPLAPYAGVDGYTLVVQQSVGLVAFYKAGTDADAVVAAIERVTSQPVHWRSPTPFSAWELRALQRWLLASPLPPWLQTSIGWTDVPADGAPSRIHVTVAVPASAWDDTRAMLEAAGVPAESYELRLFRPYEAN